MTKPIYIPKFRAWHKNLNEMMAVRALQWWEGKGLIAFFHYKGIGLSCGVNEIELMQWTCSQDKNGVDIYEGDILCYDYGGRVETYAIERDAGDLQLCIKYFCMVGCNTEHLIEIPLESSVVVGNVYEHPELVKGDND